MLFRSAFDPETGERIKTDTNISRYQDVFGEVLLDLARKNDRIVGITPAMASGCGMNMLAKAMPERFYDVGIEEEHAVTFAAGLAAGGMKPFCNIYSSFSQRAYDQIIHDVALQGLPVVICLDRGGLVGEDGATHHGCYDMSIYRSIPGAVIAAPKDEIELKDMMYSAMLSVTGPYIIRYPRGYGEGVDWKNHEYSAIETGKGEKLMDGSKVAVICAGPSSNRALEAASELKAEGSENPHLSATSTALQNHSRVKLSWTAKTSGQNGRISVRCVSTLVWCSSTQNTSCLKKPVIKI